jgi:hypothetical protein
MFDLDVMRSSADGSTRDRALRTDALRDKGKPATNINRGLPCH